MKSMEERFRELLEEHQCFATPEFVDCHVSYVYEVLRAIRKEALEEARAADALLAARASGKEVKELYEAGIAAKTELAAERALSAHRLTRIEEESKGWAAEREAHAEEKRQRLISYDTAQKLDASLEAAEARVKDLEGALRRVLDTLPGATASEPGFGLVVIMARDVLSKAGRSA